MSLIGAKGAEWCGVTQQGLCALALSCCPVLLGVCNRLCCTAVTPQIPCSWIAFECPCWTRARCCLGRAMVSSLYTRKTWSTGWRSAVHDGLLLQEWNSSPSPVCNRPWDPPDRQRSARASTDQKMCHDSINVLISGRAKLVGAGDVDMWENTGCSPEISAKGCNTAVALTQASPDPRALFLTVSRSSWWDVE